MKMQNHYKLQLIYLYYLTGQIYTITGKGDENCNITIASDKQPSSENRFTLRMPGVRPEDQSKPLYCWFRFEGTHAQVIQVDVRDVRAGDYDETTKDCQRGFLRISDTEACSTDPFWLPPTTLCGHYEPGQVRVKRITRSQMAFVEFKLDKAKPSKGYEFDVTFVDKELDPDSKLPYGHLNRISGRVPDTKCDWLIPVDECFGECMVESPGYPGIYPPNTRCQYLFTNFDDSRVELKLGAGSYSGKFDMKKSPNCSEDYVEVFDGMSTINPLIGRFCGHNGDVIISSGSSILLIFQSGPGGPPWDYSGFKVKVNDRWRDHHEGGHKVLGSLCDWVFESADSEEGDLHTPDHKLDNITQCIYKFEGEFNQRINIEVIISKMLPDCLEFLEVLDGATVLDKICKDRITKPRQSFEYRTTSPSGQVRFVRLKPQVSNIKPIWVYYTFITDLTIALPDLQPVAAVAESEDNVKYSQSGETAQSSSDGTSSATQITSTLLTFYLTIYASLL